MTNTKHISKLDKIKELAIEKGFIVEDPMKFIKPGIHQDVAIHLYVATGKSFNKGFDFAGFDESGDVIAVGKESGGPGAFTCGGWVWIKDAFGYGIPTTPLSVLWG